ncbi:response regulator [Microbacterium sp. CnD16-F]|uniref:response regulator n=1 Tax=Microbacterium sp. CnD16-F TaxID=2954493 RepID=UPI0020971463|nr:response regulator [Microbacterium sp. CnD16-F]MCO7204220.1 response regulator [Microbacterium sp. CnD16-F]
MSDIRVLIIDDDFRVAGVHRDIVTGTPGFTALDPVRTAAEALQAVRTGAPDLLLADVYLPDGDGVEVVRSCGVDAFVLSAATDARTVRRAFRAGALAYLVKPFETRTLVDRLGRYARYRNLLSDTAPLTQDQIDRAATALRGAPEQASVSRSATERTILTALADGEASASEVADRGGISRATAQRHLTALAGRGLVEINLRYGTTGRPEHRFRLAADR